MFGQLSRMDGLQELAKTKELQICRQQIQHRRPDTIREQLEIDRRSTDAVVIVPQYPPPPSIHHPSNSRALHNPIFYIVKTLPT